MIKSKAGTGGGGGGVGKHTCDSDHGLSRRSLRVNVNHLRVELESKRDNKKSRKSTCGARSRNQLPLAVLPRCFGKMT